MNCLVCNRKDAAGVKILNCTAVICELCFSYGALWAAKAAHKEQGEGEVRLRPLNVVLMNCPVHIEGTAAEAAACRVYFMGELAKHRPDRKDWDIT